MLDAFLKHLEQGGLTGYKRANIATGIGAKHMLYNLAEALLDPGDTIVFAAPYWTTYIDIADILGAKTRLLPCAASQNYKLTPAQLDAALPGAKVFLFNNPSNPTGMVYTRDEIAALADVLVEASGHLDHHRRHLQPHGVRRRRLSQLRAGTAGAARARDPGRFAVQDLRHAGLARRFHRGAAKPSPRPWSR